MLMGVCWFVCMRNVDRSKEEDLKDIIFFLLYDEDGILINDHLRSSSVITDKTDQHT